MSFRRSAKKVGYFRVVQFGGSACQYAIWSLNLSAYCGKYSAGDRSEMSVLSPHSTSAKLQSGWPQRYPRCQCYSGDSWGKDDVSRWRNGWPSAPGREVRTPSSSRTAHTHRANSKRLDKRTMMGCGGGRGQIVRQGDIPEVFGQRVLDDTVNLFNEARRILDLPQASQVLLHDSFRRRGIARSQAGHKEPPGDDVPQSVSLDVKIFCR